MSVEAGALVAKIDSLAASTRKMSSSEQLSLKASAAGSFAGFFGSHASTKGSTDNQMVSRAEKPKNSGVLSVIIN